MISVHAELDLVAAAKLGQAGLDRAGAAAVAAGDLVDGQTGVVFRQQLPFLVGVPAAAGVDGGCVVRPGLQLPEQAVDGADNLGVIVHTFIRQAIARDRVYAVRKRQKQFSCTVDVHTLTFSDKYESFSLL